MPRSATETTIEEIAKTLVKRRDQGQRPVLFLGARAGGLFGNEDFYNLLKNFSLLNFEPLSIIEKFSECHRILQRNRFNRSDIYEIFMRALRDINYRIEDELLAKLVKARFFDVIITTNIDNLLEDTYTLWDMEEPYDYRVIIHGVQDTANIISGEPRYCQMVKVFGDLNLLRFNTVGEEFDLEADQDFKKYLASQLSRDVLLVGYDSDWDWPIERAFPETGGALWYINEVSPQDNTYFARVFRQREGKYLEGIQGSFSGFWKALYDFIGEGEDVLDHPPVHSTSPIKRRVFISYSHKDMGYLDRLKVYLKAYQQKGRKKDFLNIWADSIQYDQEIKSKEGWKKKIRKALAGAKIAILLVSADFLASDFIREYQLPALLDAAKAGEVKLLSVILSPCAIKHTQLYNHQVVNSLSEPLMAMAPYEQEIVWAKLAQQVHSILDSQQ